jgi:hypothetical protein
MRFAVPLTPQTTKRSQAAATVPQPYTALLSDAAGKRRRRRSAPPADARRASGGAVFTCIPLLGERIMVDSASLDARARGVEGAGAGGAAGVSRGGSGAGGVASVIRLGARRHVTDCKDAGAGGYNDGRTIYRRRLSSAER